MFIFFLGVLSLEETQPNPCHLMPVRKYHRDEDEKPENGISCNKKRKEIQ